MRAALRLLPLALGAALACSAPSVAPGLDLYTCDGGLCPDQGVIQGSLVYSGTARGDAILLLFDTQALPPPDGSATAALEVARISQAQLFANAADGSVGPFGAPFVFTQVPSGRSYQIRAFLDVAHQFNPNFDYTLSPRAGSVAGGYGAIGSDGQPHFLPIAVAPGQVVQAVNVALTETLPYDPPSFVIAGGSQSFDSNIDQPGRLTLQAVQLPAPDASFAHAHFAVELDRDASDNPQSSFADGIIDVFPRVVLQQIAAGDGSAVAAGQGAIIPCRTLAIPILPAVLQLPLGAVPLALDTLQVLVEPVAVSAATHAPLPQIPAGVYQIAVIEKTGQVWTLPNTLGNAGTAGDDFVASQAETVTFAPLETLPPGSISGEVVFQGGSSIKSGNLIVQAYLDDPDNPPPPLGPALPVRVEVLQAAQVTATPSGFTADYQIAGLPAGNYIVEALDDVDGNFSALDLLETPTRADLTGAVIDTSTLRPKSIAVSGGAVTGEDVTMTGPLGLDPPAFAIDPSQGPASMPADSVGPVRFGLLAQPFSFPMGAAAQPTFTVSLVRDANGATVDADGDGLPDVWPRVFLVRLDPGDPTLLTQYQDPQNPDRTLTEVIPAAVDPTPFLPALLATPGGAGTILAQKVTVIARPSLVNATNPDAQTRGPLQPGNYKIVVINQTGQVWQIPNQANPAALDPSVVCAAGVVSCPAGTVQTQSQGGSFQVTLPGPLFAGAIAGSLSVSGISHFVGAYIFAYSAANPPPPVGTGTPVSGDFHSAAEFVGGAVSFALPDLPLGSYLVTAVVDTRGDFALSPQLFAAAPGEGTVLAEHAGLVTLTDASPQATGANISATAAGAVPPRPSFVLRDEDGNTIASDISTLFPDSITPQRISVHAQQILSAQVSLDPEADAPQFLVAYQGCDAQGAPIDADDDNLPDLYPRVLVVKLADSDPSGLTVDPDTTVIPAAVDPTGFALGACTQHAILPASDLSVILSPIAVRISGATQTQEPIPAGRYGVVLMQSTGQTWRLPNELQPALLDPRSAAAVSLGSQGVGIRVASQVPAARPGSISGLVTLTGYSTGNVGDVLIAAYASNAPPPPLGLGRPLAVQLIPRAVFAGGVPPALPYLLANLVPGSYLLAAEIDPRDELSPLLDFMSTPPMGAQVSFSSGPVTVGSAAVTGVDVTLSEAQQAVPFERPAFALTGSTLSISSGAPTGTSVATLDLTPDAPAGVPYMLATAPLGHVFHPVATGADSRTCGGAHTAYLASNVYVTPIGTGSTLVPAVTINNCQFCVAITGTADCSGAPLAVPVMAGTLQVQVANVAVDPATRQVVAQAVPIGHYAVTLVEATGQSWTVPNDLRAADGTQAVVFTVTP